MRVSMTRIYHPQQSDLNPHAAQRQTACMRYTSPPHRSQTIFSSFEDALLLGCAIDPVVSGVMGLTGFESVMSRERVQRGRAETRRMMASLKSGMSSGLRDVMRLPSSTTGLSTYMPPAFFTSIAIDGQQVSVRPRSALAALSTCGP